MSNTNCVSRWFGRFASHRFPPSIQAFINRVYVKIFDLDLSEFAPPEEYESLNALFTRALQKQRKFDSNPKKLISPVDSKITQFGEVKHNTALQIKGMSYCVSEFLGEVLDEGYSYVNFYLSPRDYHRFHAPCDLEVLEVRYFAGVLLSVNEKALHKHHNLFIQNERVVVVAKDQQGNVVYYVAVGALNVGQMLLGFEPRIQTNAQPNENVIYRYQTPIKIAKGAEMGMFKMGSTVVLFGKEMQWNLQIGQKVKFSETIGEFQS